MRVLTTEKQRDVHQSNHTGPQSHKNQQTALMWNLQNVKN